MNVMTEKKEKKKGFLVHEDCYGINSSSQMMQNSSEIMFKRRNY